MGGFGVDWYIKLRQRDITLKLNTGVSNSSGLKSALEKPNQKNKVPFPNSSGVVWTRTQSHIVPRFVLLPFRVFRTL